MKNVQAFGERVIENIEKVIVGKRDTVELAINLLALPGTTTD